MQLKSLRWLIIPCCFALLSVKVNAQSCIPTNINGTVINLNCNQVCSTLVFPVPHIKGTDDYVVSGIPYAAYPYDQGTQITINNQYIDDRFSALIAMPFSFCFYNQNYNNMVVGSNGVVTFEALCALANNAYTLTVSGSPQTIPYNGGSGPSGIATTYYPRTAIMGAYHDIDPSQNPLPTRRIEYNVFGTAPCRKLVVSYFDIRMFSGTCNSLVCSQQIVMHESTGLIDVFFLNKPSCTTWEGGRSILGIQDETRTKAVAAPGKNCTAWSESNTGYRFTPSGTGSRYVISEMLNMSGTVVATADTLTTVAGLLDIRYQNFCTPPGSTQFVVRTQFSACDNPANLLISLDTITINRTNSLGAGHTTTSTGCGGPSGTITVTVPPGVGTPPYTYILDGGTPVVGPSPYTFTNVGSGGHTIVVTDASAGCTSTINPNVALTGTITETHATTQAVCAGSASGSITINTATGTGPYTFSLDGAPAVPGVLPFTFNNLTPGPHTVQINDLGTSCNSGPISITVPSGPGVLGSQNSTPTSCPGVNNGTITVLALAVPGPFTWSLDGAPGVPGPSPYTFTNVAAGGHTVVITDLSSGCSSVPLVVNVATGSGIAGTQSSTATSCPGATNGTITVTALSGTGPYTWSLDGAPAVPGASPYTFTNVTSGAHTVVITDVSNGCSSVPLAVNVAAGSGITASQSSTQASCATANNGTITVTALTGTGPFTWSLDGAPAVPGASPYTFTNVSSGAHNVVINDLSNGCSSLPIAVNVAAGPGVNGSSSSLATSCPAAANGSITITVSTGTAPYTFTLDGGAPQSGASPYTFNNVASGSHTVVVTDNNGCSTTLPPITVNAGPVLTGNASMNATSCSGATDGSITVTPTGGAAPFTFSLDGGAPQSGAAPYTFNNVPAGTHNVIITDAAGCATNQIPANVTAGPALATTATTSPALCNGSATGSITVTIPSMGTAPYQYSLNGVVWQASNIFNGLTANTYTVYYQSSNGCSGSTPNVVVSAPASVAASSSTTPVSCNGLSDGTITITASGGVPPYQYSINGGGSWQASNVFTVPANSYPNILIRDANNCSTTQSVTVTEPAALAASSLTSNATCNGGADGTITVTATGGNAGYQYSLDGVNFQGSNVFNVVANTYTVTIRDIKGCITTITATVGQTNDLTFTPQVDPTICEGTSTQLNLVSNATQYAWTPATGLSSTTIPNPMANPTATTSYTVTATLGLCSATDVVVVNVNAAPVPNAGPDGFICYGQTYQLQGSGGSQYTWTPSTYLDNPAIATPISSATKTITYTLSEVTDAIGCKSLVTDQVIVDVTPPIKVTTFPFDTVAHTGDQFQLNATSIANMYSWSPAFGLSNPNIPNPIVTVGPIGSDVVYKVTASTIAGCIGEGYVRIKVYLGPDIYMATGFTPNNDGKNDKFTPFPVGIVSIKYFRVFNRWGQLVFSTNTLHDGWDGKLGGVDQPNGVYAWMVEGISKDGKVITKKGTVTLIR